MSKVYAVKKGKKTGLFYSWSECQESIKGYSGAEFKSFSTEQEAIAYLNGIVEEKKSTIIKCKKDKECNVYVMGCYDTTTKLGGFGIIIESKNEKSSFYMTVVSEEKGSAIYSELIGSLAALQLAKQMGFTVIRLYANIEGIVKWAEHEWVPKDKLKIRFCDYCDLLQKDKNYTVSFFVLDDNYIKKSLKVLTKRSLIEAENYIDISKVLNYNITLDDVYLSRW